MRNIIIAGLSISLLVLVGLNYIPWDRFTSQEPVVSKDTSEESNSTRGRRFIGLTDVEVIEILGLPVKVGKCQLSFIEDGEKQTVTGEGAEFSSGSRDGDFSIFISTELCLISSVVVSQFSEMFIEWPDRKSYSGSGQTDYNVLKRVLRRSDRDKGGDIENYSPKVKI